MTADAGITKNVSFHTSRHTFDVLTLAAGSDLYTVGKLVGHTSINSTQVYADVVMETKLKPLAEFQIIFLTCKIRVEKISHFSARIVQVRKIIEIRLMVSTFVSITTSAYTCVV